MRVVVSSWLSLVVGVGVSHLQVLLQVSVHCLFSPTGCVGPPPSLVWCRVAGVSSGFSRLSGPPVLVRPVLSSFNLQCRSGVCLPGDVVSNYVGGWSTFILNSSSEEAIDRSMFQQSVTI
jgi:hypothetical protein